jgi:phenylacetate-CoA ligase
VGQLAKFEIPESRDRMLDRSMEAMDRSDLLAYQEQRLPEALAYVESHSPFFAETWKAAGLRADEVSSLADFCERVPFVDKDTIRAYRGDRRDSLGGLRRMEHVATLSSSTGTTGDPLVLPSGYGYGPTDGGGLARDWWEIGVRPGDAVAFMLFTFRGAAWLTAHALGASCALFDHHPAEFARWSRASIELQPTLLYLLSGPLIMAMAYMEEAGLLSCDLTEVFASYRGVVIGGEPLGARARADLERWGGEPFLHTAVGDVGSATECREHDGLHLSEDSMFVEILDPQGTEPVREGDVGELVATTLVPRSANPLIRFRSEDLVRASTAPCRCGRTGMRLWPVGRKGDEVVVDGRSILPMDVWQIVEAVPESTAGYFQIVRTGRSMPQLKVRVGFDPGETGRAAVAVRADLTETIASVLGIAAPDIELVDNEVLLRQGPPHKIPRVVSS